MAKVSMILPKDFEMKISELGNRTDEICAKVAQAGADVVLPIVKRNLIDVIGDTKYPSKSTGELVNALGVSPPKVDRKGVINVKIGFNEPRRNQYDAKGKRSYKMITNAMIANVIEYGKSGQDAKPFLARAKRQSKNACIDAMKAKFEQEVNEI